MLSKQRQNSLSNNLVFNKYNTKFANWQSFNSDFIEIIPDILEEIKLNYPANNIISKFQEHLIKCCNDNIPLKRSVQHPVPWWSPELTDLKRKVNAFRRSFQSCKKPDIRSVRLERYKAEKRKYQLLIRQSKRESWSRFCTESGNADPWNTVYKFLKNNRIKILMFHY